MWKACQAFAVTLFGWFLLVSGLGLFSIGALATSDRTAVALVMLPPPKGDPDDPYHEKDCETQIDAKEGTGCGWSDTIRDCSGDCNPSKDKCKPTDEKKPVCKDVTTAPNTRNCWCQSVAVKKAEEATAE